jgi:hypothetical protein
MLSSVAESLLAVNPASERTRDKIQGHLFSEEASRPGNGYWHQEV